MFSKASWPADVAEPLYVIPVDDSLRVLLFAHEGRDPEVVDIVRHETLQQFAGAR